MPDIKSLKSIRNFRDFGGYKGLDGRALKTDMLFRSAHFADTNDDDAQYLDSLDLGLFVDLRHYPERRRQPSQARAHGSSKVLELSEQVTSDQPEYAPHEMFLKEQLQTADDARRYMMGSYSERPRSPIFIKAFSDTLKFMAQEGDPLVIHCAAGKDRTGTLVAIIQKILGVEQDQIYHDYMLTMEAVDIESFLEPAAQMMSHRFGRPIEANALRPMFGVEAPYLEASFDAMGDFESYIADTLQISGAEQDAIRAAYLMA